MRSKTEQERTIHPLTEEITHFWELTAPFSRCQSYQPGSPCYSRFLLILHAAGRLHCPASRYFPLSWCQVLRRGRAGGGDGWRVPPQAHAMQTLHATGRRQAEEGETFQLHKP
ncbi:hypothetical protein KIL84_017123 [Mauremys mutica]|uniref:Uncharacterized protein n=1 Tax=Mauremys mutica TaxID=74926 RepID=A0A9D3X3R9_9SAUR|nr:hypothetical protein KIL84_017123 [Mauremys mutica]